MNRITPIFLLIAGLSCQVPTQKEQTQVPVEATEKDPTKIYNLMGEELPPKQLSDEVRAKHEKNLREAKSNFEANPDSLELIVWYGRRLAYLGRYQEAIGVFSDGIAKFPLSHTLRRHRGHRYITTRQINNAIEDFELAAYYSMNVENAIEPDGLPNKLNKPLGNDKFNIWYHFGLAHYLNGRFDKASSAYNKCMNFSDNPDLLVATTYWQYLTYKKLGNNDLAYELLKDINSEMKLIENTAYLDLLLLFKGEKDVDKLLDEAMTDGQLNPTHGYGIGSYYQHQGNLPRANEIFLKIMESPQWDAFGYIAAEAELKATFPVP